MTMRDMPKMIYVLAAIAFFLPMATALSAATSNAIAKTDGTRAAEAWFNPNSPAWIDVYDAKCDAHAVYVQYSINAGSQIRKDNNGGCGTTLQSP